MTWSELKKAVEESGIQEEDEICTIQCAIQAGNKRLNPVKLGKFVRLTEGWGEAARKDASGCCA